MGQVVKNCQCGITRMPLGDETVDGLVSMILKGWVGEFGEDFHLVKQGTLKRVSRAGVEHSARQSRVSDTIN